MTQTDPFAYIDGLQDPTSVHGFMKIAIVGKPKTGKSWMAASVPGTVLHYDFDGRAASLTKCDYVKNRVYKVKTLIDISQSSPTAMKAIEGDLSTFKAAKAAGNSIPDSFIFDSVTYMKKAMENEAMAQSSDIYRSVKLNGLKKILRIPAGWDAINITRGYCEYIFNEFSQLGNVIFVFHQKDEKDKAESTKTEAKYTGRQTVEPQFLETLLALFNEVFYVDVDPYDQNKFKVYTQINGDVSAATTLLLDAEEVPNIQQMLEKHKLNQLKNQIK